VERSAYETQNLELKTLIMTERQFTKADGQLNRIQKTNATENQRSLVRLIRAISLSKDQFALILVRSNY
jgi:hypothetical protein